MKLSSDSSRIIAWCPPIPPVTSLWWRMQRPTKAETTLPEGSCTQDSGMESHIRALCWATLIQPGATHVLSTGCGLPGTPTMDGWMAGLSIVPRPDQPTVLVGDGWVLMDVGMAGAAAEQQVLWAVAPSLGSPLAVVDDVPRLPADLARQTGENLWP